jgi:TolA-binding protein
MPLHNPAKEPQAGARFSSTVRSSTSLLSLALTAALSIVASGCLKTRAQLRQEEDVDAATPRQASVQDVQPRAEYVIEELKSEITRLTGRIEDLERAQKEQSSAASQQEASSEERRKLEERVQELEQAQERIILELKKAQEKFQEKLQEAPTGAGAKPATELLDRAKKEFRAGNHQAVVDLLADYLKAPKAPRGEEATFLKAESHFALKQWKKSILEFSRFPEKYTTSKYMPMALSKIARAFEAMGMREDAKGFYQELVDKFPKSPEAAKARAAKKVQ